MFGTRSLKSDRHFWPSCQSPEQFQPIGTSQIFGTRSLNSDCHVWLGCQSPEQFYPIRISQIFGTRSQKSDCHVMLGCQLPEQFQPSKKTTTNIWFGTRSLKWDYHVWPTSFRHSSGAKGWILFLFFNSQIREENLQHKWRHLLSDHELSDN